MFWHHFKKWQIKPSILIIWHFGNFFNVARYTFLLLKSQHSSCWQCCWPFSEAKVKLWGSKILVKTKETHVLFSTNQFYESVHPQPSPNKNQFIFWKKVTNVFPFRRCANSGNYSLVIFRNFFELIKAVFRYCSEKCKA